jgi:ABC-type thiamin/hydroxymethylpyrimidine transport system permease subunit
MKAIALLKEVLASLGKFSISGDFTKADCLLNVFQFITCEVGFVERDVGCRLAVIVQLVIVFNGGFNPTTCYSQNGIHR